MKIDQSLWYFCLSRSMWLGLYMYVIDGILWLFKYVDTCMMKHWIYSNIFNKWLVILCMGIQIGCMSLMSHLVLLEYCKTWTSCFPLRIQMRLSCHIDDETSKKQGLFTKYKIDSSSTSMDEDSSTKAASMKTILNILPWDRWRHCFSFM